MSSMVANADAMEIAYVEVVKKNEKPNDKNLIRNHFADVPVLLRLVEYAS